MNIEVRDIRFLFAAGEVLALKGFIDRKDLMNAKDGFVIINNIAQAFTKRLSDLCELDIMNHGEWVHVKSGDYEAIELVYADVEAIETPAQVVVEEPKEEEKVVEPEAVEETPVVEEQVVEEPIPEVVEEQVEEHQEVAEEAPVEEPVVEEVSEVVEEKTEEVEVEEAPVEEVPADAPVAKEVVYQSKPVHVNKKKHR